MGWVRKDDTLGCMEDQPESNKPVAYDAEGRPLYYQSATPEALSPSNNLVASKAETIEGHDFNPQIRTQYANEPDFAHATRPVEPTVSEISDELRRKHDESVRLYPNLNLSEGEFVVLRISRHPIGLLIPCFFTAIAVIVVSTMLLLLPDFYKTMEPSSLSESAVFLPSRGLIALVLLLLMFFSVFLGAVSLWVYQKNHFFLTNESVIQEIQHSLFSHHEQTVSLGSIEDASFKRQGILQHLFNYGTMRLSTEGEETTYRFGFVENPKEQVATVSNAVEAFKNGRPVKDD